MYLSVLAKRIFIVWYTMVSVLMIYTHIIPNNALLYLFFGSLPAELLAIFIILAP
jgi:formate/nitrite transporter FocA (FNT family)